MTVSVISTYFPHPTAMDEVLDLLQKMFLDPHGARVGCVDQKLFVCRAQHKIVTVTAWDSKELFEAYIDSCVSNGTLMEIQSDLMIREIETDLYDAVDAAPAMARSYSTAMQKS